MNTPVEMVLMLLSKPVWFSISEKEEGMSEGKRG
jgi:hypothetical protein